jgi:hypothetical protein
MMGIARISPLENNLDAPKHLARTPGIDNLTASHLHLDAKVPFYPGNWIYRDSLAHIVSSRFPKVDVFLNQPFVGYLSL